MQIWIAQAIECADVVIIFVSRAYRDSYNCKLEGKYAQVSYPHTLTDSKTEKDRETERQTDRERERERVSACV